MGTTTNQQFQIVLSHRDKPLAFMAMVNGKKVYFWDKSFMNAPAHGDLEFFLEELYTAISDIMDMPNGWIKFPRWEKMITSLIYGVDQWPNKEGNTEGTNRIFREENRFEYVEFYGMTKR